MADCCESKCGELVELRARQSWVLKTVLVINLIMFGAEVVGGILSRSSALLADSLDMFGDAWVYALSLMVLSRGSRWQAKVSWLKGAIMAVFAAAVLIAALYRFSAGIVPEAPEMGAFGTAALMANLGCLYLLFRHRDDSLNMRSTWLCSRNDILANVTVLGAAAWIHLSGQAFPDLIVALGIAGLFAVSAWGVLRDARTALLNPDILSGMGRA